MDWREQIKFKLKAKPIQTPNMKPQLLLEARVHFTSEVNIPLIMTSGDPDLVTIERKARQDLITMIAEPFSSPLKECMDDVMHMALSSTSRNDMIKSLSKLHKLINNLGK